MKAAISMTLAVCVLLVAIAVLVFRGIFTGQQLAEPPRGAERGGVAGMWETRGTNVPPEAEAPPEVDVVPDGPIPAGTSGLVALVLDAQGKAVRGAAATFHCEGGSDRGVTDGRGEVVFSGIREGAYMLRLKAPRKPDLVSAGKILVEPGETRRINIRVGDFDLTLSGAIQSLGGLPITGIKVVASLLPFYEEEILMVPADGSSRQAVSDAEGFYIVGGLQDGDYELRTIPTERYPSVRMVVPAGLDSVDLILEEGRILRIRGNVTAREGQPLEDVLVSQLERPREEARTGSDGSYSLDFLLGRRRTYNLTFRREGYRKSQFAIHRDQVKEATEWELNAKLEPAGPPAAVTGVLVTSAGLPLNGESVHLQSPSLGTSLTTVSDPNGRFFFPEVPPGEDYRIRVRPRRDFKDFLSSPLPVAEDGLELQISLDPLGAGEIHGQMVDAGGNPLPRFQIWLRNTEAAGKSRVVVGDDEGRFDLEGVPAGELVFQTRSDPRFDVRGVKLAAATATEVRILLDLGPHNVTGTVVDPTGAPLLDVRAELSWHHSEGPVRSSSDRTTTTDDAGRFQFVRVGRGPHRLVLSAPRYRSVQLDCEVVGEIRLPPIEMAPLGQR